MSDHTHSCTTFGGIGHELRSHMPFTMAGTLAGVALMVIMTLVRVPHELSEELFHWGAHPLHVFLSALATTAMYRLHGGGRLRTAILVGYFGSIGIATLSDCVIPYLGERLLGHHPHVHAGFLDMWYLVNPLAAAGIALGYWRPNTRYPHAGHVLLSIWASLSHMIAELHGELDAVTMLVVAVFLFLAVWVPCCTSDIVFPLLFARTRRSCENVFSENEGNQK